MPVGKVHVFLVTRLLLWLGNFLEKSRLGFAGPELGVVLSRDPDTVLGPDIAFIAKSRMTDPSSPKYFEGAPDLAVEVLSPRDLASEVQEKTHQYLKAGTRQVWIVDPKTETVTVHLPGGSSQSYSADSVVDGGDVLPGFSFRPADLFHYEE